MSTTGKKQPRQRKTATKRRSNQARHKSPSGYRYSNASRRQQNARGRQHRKLATNQRKAEYLSSMPKGRLKRLLYHMHPVRFFKFWFSKDGLKLGFKMGLLGVLMMVLLGAGVFAYYSRSLDINDINRKDLAQTTEFYDRTGQTLLYRVFQDENRTVLEQDQMSEFVRQGTVAIEDKGFYDHAGFSPSGIVRAMVNNVLGGDQQGASTITQQFVKNRLLSNERTYTRKIKEVVLSIQLERRFSKDEILTLYLNQVAYGGTAYGIEAASAQYFGKTAVELDLAESAMLAAIPQAPSRYSPIIGGEANQVLVDRTKSVLDAMAVQGYITQEQADEAKKVDIIARINAVDRTDDIEDIIAPHFVLEAKAELEQQLGTQLVQQGGLKVITTLDLDTQRIAEDAIRKRVDDGLLESNGANNTAFSMSDPATGHVIALVGSRDFTYIGDPEDPEDDFGQFNAAAAYRQPGSSFKPYSYAELFKSKDWGPGSPMWDVPTNFTIPPDQPYEPGNFDLGFDGKRSIRSHLGRSRNIPAIKSLYLAGLDNVLALTDAMGVPTNPANESVLATALGGREVRLMDHVNAYTVFANGGTNHGLNMIISATTPNGEVVAEYADKNEQVLDAEISYLISDMLADRGARAALFGSNSPYVFPSGIDRMALKTGTTNGSIDGWMMAYTPHVSAGIWQGRHDNKETTGRNYVFNGLVLMEIMNKYHERFETLDDFERPPGIKEVRLDPITGRQSNEGVSDIYPSWYEPRIFDPNAKKVEIDVVTNKLATECTPDTAKAIRSDSGVVPELPPEDALFGNWSRPTGGFPAGYADAGATSSIVGTDDLHQCSDVRPTATLNFSGPSAANTFTLTANITRGTHDLERVIFKVDGQVVSDQGIDPGGGSYSFATAAIVGAAVFEIEVWDVARYVTTSSRSYTPNSGPDDSNGRVVITAPGSGASLPATSATVRWQALTDADRYRACVREAVGGASLDCTATESLNITYSGLNPSSTYTVYVEAIDGEGDTIAGSRSTSVTFSTSN